MALCVRTPLAGAANEDASARGMAVGLCVAAALLLLGAGCAGAPSRPGLEYRADAPGAVAERLWPSPPEVPRYRYVGDLTGERNLQRGDGNGSAGGGGWHWLHVAWLWLTGLKDDSLRAVELQRPQGGVTDDQGRVYVTDVSRQAVFVFDGVSGELRLWELADGRRRFVAPVGIAIDDRGELLVTDAELGAVFRFRADGTFLRSFGEGILQRPTGIAYDRERRRIFVADTDANDVKVFDAQGRLMDTLGFAGEGPGRLNRPVYLAFARGRLFVSDALNARVQVFDRDGNMAGTIGARGLYVGNLTRPKGVAVDSEGHVYVVEGFYDHLLVFMADGRFLMSIGGTGQRPGQFYLPAGAWTDHGDRIYVADMFNGRVCVFQFLGAEP